MASENADHQHESNDNSEVSESANSNDSSTDSSSIESQDSAKPIKRKFILFIVYIALFVDYALMTVVVPIVPEVLVDLDTKNGTANTEDLSEHSIPIAMMLGSKGVVQMIANLFAGPLTNKIGYSVVMFAGFVVIALSTVMFAFSNSYWLLFTARSVQGIGSAFAGTAGTALVAKIYTNPKERARALGVALGGVALGSLVGPPYGGLMFHWGGLLLPFGILAIITVFDGGLQLCLMPPKIEKEECGGHSMGDLLKDPYVIITAGAIAFANLGLSMLEPALPLWMMENWNSDSVEQGFAFLPCTIGYLIVANFFGSLSAKLGFYKCGFVGLIGVGAAGIWLPFAQSFYGLIAPNLFIGMFVGLIDATMFPLLAEIADKRHAGNYGSIYALADSSVCLACVVGPFLAGPLVKFWSFKAMMIVMAVLNIAFAPVVLFLKKVEPKKIKKDKSQSKSTIVDSIPSLETIDNELKKEKTQKY